MVNTRSTTRNQPSRLTPSVMARRQRNSPQPIQNPPFCHRYDNLPERPSDTPSHARITEVNPSDPNPGPPDNEGNGDDNDSNNSNPGSVPTPVPEPGSEPEPKDTGKVLAKALTRIVEFVEPDKQESLRISVKEPDQFDRSDQRKLQGFLLQLKLNFRAKKKSFRSDVSDKVTYALSFLKGTALDYFEPYLTDNPDQEPANS